jgi:subfamily B ATP-binding cassette protein MsbA
MIARPNDLLTLRRLWRIAGVPRWSLPSVVALSTVSTIAEGIGIGLLIPILGSFGQGSSDFEADDEILGRLGALTSAIPEDRRILVLSMIVFALIAVKSILVYFDGLLSSWVTGLAAHRLRLAVAHQLLTVRFDYINENDDGRFLNTLESDTWAVTSAMFAVLGFVTRICVILVYGALLLLLSWKLTLAFLVGSVCVWFATRPFARFAWRESPGLLRAEQIISERACDLLDAMRTIRAFGKEEAELQRFGRASETLRTKSFSVERLTGLTGPVLELVYVALFLFILIVAQWTGMQGAALVTYLVALYRVQPHVRALDGLRLELASVSAPLQNIDKLLDRSDKPYVPDGSRRFEHLRDSVTFRDVNFGYSLSQPVWPVLKGVSFEIAAGKVTAIVGGSGAGKTTLINLLLRLYDPDSGEILVDGVPLSTFDIGSWRSRLAIAGQDIELLNGTVRDNIAYSRPDATIEEIVAAAIKASAHDFIAAMPKGYDTRVGDAGALLSGGQRQRLGLARAILAEPRLLILDEATNALDAITEDSVLTGIESWRGDMTVVVVAHRLSTLRQADHVVVLEDGKVRESGPPRQLIEQKGLFARLRDLQLIGD